MFRKPKSEWESIKHEVENGSPIVPRHAQPISVEQDGFTSLIDQRDREAFAISAPLAAALDKMLGWGAWRAQESNRTLITLFDSPAHGRNFDVFYNNHAAGDLCVYASPEMFDHALKNIVVTVRIDYAQLFPFEHLRTFLYVLAGLHGGESYSERSRAIETAMLTVLWETMRLPDRPHQLEIFFEGTAEALRDRISFVSP